MNREKSKHTLLIWFMGMLCSVLVIGLFTLTILQKGKWNKYVEDISQRTVYEKAPRGDILDRNGEFLATSKPIYSVKLSKMGIDREKAVKISFDIMRILEINGENVETTQEDVNEALASTGYYSYMPVLLAENISKETAEEISSGNYPGVEISLDYERYYPQGALASHIIGYLGRISESDRQEFTEEDGYREESLVGKDGIEKICEKQLKGKDTVSKFRIDSLGKVREYIGKDKGSKGSDVRLTVDSDVQRITENALEQAVCRSLEGGTFESDYGNVAMTYAKNAGAGAAVVLEVGTGKVLAMASYPDFDPNDFIGEMTEEKWQSLQSINENDPLSPSPLYNVAAMTAVQPGSTFKPVTALAALSCGLDKNRYLYDDGYISLGNNTYGCFLWNDTGGKHGYLDLNNAMKVSCNYYFYDIASGYDYASGTSLEYDNDINNEKILNVAHNLGLGEKTGIEINESAGVIPSEMLKLQGIKSSLKNYLLAESETYFTKNAVRDRDGIYKKIEKIVDWADKDLTLDEIIGKLKSRRFVKQDKIEKLASVCKYDYFDQSHWNTGDTFNISIGQGDNAYTTLQMANYMATLGNGGIKTNVTLLEDSAIEKQKASEIPQEDIKAVIEAMTEVTKEGGSLSGLFYGFPYSVAAKTGTAQRAGYISDEEEKEYLRRHLHLIAPDITFDNMEVEAERLMKEYPDIYKSEDTALRRAVKNLSRNDVTTEDIDRYKERYDNFAWTVALAPADDPEIAVAVMLVQGKTSANAAPAVREIIGKYGEKSGWEKLF